MTTETVGGADVRTVRSEETSTSAPAQFSIGRTAYTSAAARPVIEAPSSQAYYWSEAWQRNERIAAAELARGEGVAFDSVTDAIKWLLSSEE